MAHNAYIRGSIGAWATGTTVSQAEFWQMDQYIYGAINGDAGGTWAPATTINIGGAGLAIGGSSSFSCASPASFASSLDLVGVLEVHNNCAIGDSAAHSLVVNAESTFTSVVDISSILTISGTGEINISSGGQLVAPGDNLLGSTPGTTGKSTTLIGDLASAGGGGRLALSLADLGDATYSLGYYHRYFYTTLSANRPLYLTIDNPRVGTEFHVHNKASTYLVQVYIGGVFVASVLAGTNMTFVRLTSSWDSFTF